MLCVCDTFVNFHDRACVSLSSAFGSLPCLAHFCHCDLKSTSCIDLSITEGALRLLPRPRVLLKAPTLAEMEEMNLFEVCVLQYSEKKLGGIRGRALAH